MRRFTAFVLVFCAIVAFGALAPRHNAVCHSLFRHSLFRRAGFVVHAAALPANWHTGECDDKSDHWGKPHVCQMRQTTFTLPSGHLSVNTTNGGIQVMGEDRSDVELDAKVTAWAPSEAEARDLLNQVAIDTDNGNVRDHGPRMSFMDRTGYNVSYKLHVPKHLAGVEVHSMNGGIDLAKVDGAIRFATTNGGVELSDLSGDVQGQTVNGGLEIALSGDRWQGDGLNASTTNGGIEMHVPANYSAHLETSTVNGGISVGFPVTVQGEIKNHLDTDLGSGGATVHVQTTNGGVEISRGGSGSTNTTD